jgi:hypothetical protein
MNEIDHWLERLFWIAMISIPFLAIWAGRIALRKVQTALQQVDAASGISRSRVAAHFV